MRLFKECRVSIGAENCHYEATGAYTGEVSADMLKDLGVKYVIIGHSERRQYFGETDFTVNKKVLAALEAGLHPIICVGESLEQRELGITMELIALQVKSALAGVPAEKVRKCVIAYEPIWAIGTGKTATAEQAAWRQGFAALSGEGGRILRRLEPEGDEQRILGELTWAAGELTELRRRLEQESRQREKLWFAGLFSGAGLLLILLI